MNLETKITIYKFTPQVFTLTQDFYRFLSYCELDAAECDAHFRLKIGFSIKHICKSLKTNNQPIGRVIYG